MLKPAEPAMQPKPGSEHPIGELVSQLVDEGQAYAKAEIGLAKAIASAKVDSLKVPAILLGVAFLFVQAAITVLAVAVLLGLLPLVGPVLAGLLAFLVFAGIAAGLGWYAVEMIRREL
jgi:hypothetical protein